MINTRRAGVKPSVSWSQIERTILLRIARNEYLPGQRIPTCEALAAELGANKNTVSKAYRSLAERGYLLTRAGFGTFISRRKVRADVDYGLDDLTGLLSLAVQEAKLRGLGQAQFRKFFDDVIAQGYGRTAPRIGFVECNRHDATMLSRDLQLAVSHPIEPLLIDDILANPAQILLDYDILAVNITHLSAVESALASIGASRAAKNGLATVVGMHIPIDSDSLLRVARLRPGTRVGVVCDLKQTINSLKGMVHGFNPSLEVDGCLSRDRVAVSRLLAVSDVLLVTPSAAGRTRMPDPQIPIITLAFRLDERSVEQLSTLIAQAMPAPVAHDRTPTSRRVAARAR